MQTPGAYLGSAWPEEHGQYSLDLAICPLPQFLGDPDPTCPASELCSLHNVSRRPREHPSYRKQDSDALLLIEPNPRVFDPRVFQKQVPGFF